MYFTFLVLFIPLHRSKFLSGSILLKPKEFPVTFYNSTYLIQVNSSSFFLEILYSIFIFLFT